MADEVCRYCGQGRHAPEACPRVASIEYEYPVSAGPNKGDGNDRLIKRVTFHPPRSPEAELADAFFNGSPPPRHRARASRGWWVW